MRTLPGYVKADMYFANLNPVIGTEQGGRIRILLSSFEEWYANQFSYYKTNGPLPGAALRETTLSVAEIAQLLGIAEGMAEELLAKIKLEQVVVYGKRRILRDSCMGIPLPCRRSQGCSEYAGILCTGW